MTDTETIADVVVAAVRATTGPMAGDLSGMAARMTAMEASHAALVTQMAMMGESMDACQADMAACVARMAALEVKVNAMPAPMPGKDGTNGLNGTDGRDGQPGVPGRDGAPGDRGEKGQNGAPGRDGTLEQAGLEQVDERTWRLVRADGTPVSGEFHAAVVLDRGVYQAGKAYEKGDGVTFGGSFWIAQDATSEKPGDGATKWRLAVKAGREGREGKPGKDGSSGPKGEKGDSGRNYS